MERNSFHHRLSPFTPDEIRGWRDRLLDLRRALLRDAEQISAESVASDPGPRDHSEAAASTEVAISATQDVHQTVSLIDRALAKIASREPVPFGICEETGMPIEADRIDLMPWTPVSSAGARLRERSGASA